MPLLLPFVVLYLALIALGLPYCLWKGGRDERSAAVIIILAIIGSEIAARQSSAGWARVEYGVMLVDAATFIALLFVVHRSSRFWPLWAAASQLVATLTHVAFLGAHSIVATTYATTQPVWAFPLISAVVVGTWTRPRHLPRPSSMRNPSSRP